jgi:hypothetical protein
VTTLGGELYLTIFFFIVFVREHCSLLLLSIVQSLIFFHQIGEAVGDSFWTILTNWHTKIAKKLFR